jgi:hypothetical protein
VAVGVLTRRQLYLLSQALRPRACDALAVGSMLFTLGFLERREVAVWICSVLGYFLVSLPATNLAYWRCRLAPAELGNTSTCGIMLGETPKVSLFNSRLILAHAPQATFYSRGGLSPRLR